MGNWDRHLGEHYLRRTLYDTGIFGEAVNEPAASVEPLPFKVYRDVSRYRLSQSLPLNIGGVRSAVGCSQPEASDSGLDTRVLSTLLYYTYGLSRRDEGPGAVWPLHRLVASARCLFPTELYVCFAGTEEIPAGVYHYDTLHQALELLRLGDYRSELSDAVGSSVEGTECVLLLSALFWKNAFKYHLYSYRLCSQEAGMVVGNALMVAGALGLAGLVHYQFVDEYAGKLLGLDRSEEQVFAVVPMYSGFVDGLRTRTDTAQSRSPDSIPPIAPSFVGQQDFEHDLGELFSSIADNSLLTSVDEFRREPAAPSDRQCADTVLRPPGSGEDREFELAETLRSRDSGNVLFNPVKKPLSQADFWGVVRHAMAPYACDLRETGWTLPMELYVAAFDVSDVPLGTYRFCGDHGGLHPIAEGDFSRPLQGAMVIGNVNLCGSNIVMYVGASYAAASETFGNRAYRILNMEGGLVAHRICTSSAACGLSARIHNGYDSKEIKDVFRMAEDVTPLFQISVAHNRPGVQYALPILF